jgi:predicted nuclease of restriction endonuclease-like (RecB) superfamily
MNKPALFPDKNYLAFLHRIKDRIMSARINAARSVNSELILLYWDIGRGIVEKQKDLGWGESVIEVLSHDIKKAFPGVEGFSDRNMRDMKRFYLAYCDQAIWQQAVAKLPSDVIRRQPVAKLNAEFLQQLVAEIPWGHHLLILNKTTDAFERLYYLQATAKIGWSRNVLLNQIKANAYDRALKEKKAHNFPAVLPERLAEQADEALKSSYNLEFLGIRREVRERELESGLIERLQDFILELGYGFCFIGRQYRIAVGQKEYFIDLLFYHRFLKALVAIELKVGEFEPEYAGKMDFYLNLLNEREKAADDNPSIGIILCAEKDDMVVEFSLSTKMNPIGVAEYQLTKRLPRELKGKLPSERELKAVLLSGTKK